MPFATFGEPARLGLVLEVLDLQKQPADSRRARRWQPVVSAAGASAAGRSDMTA